MWEAGTALFSDDDFLGLASHGNNIIHVAAERGRLGFIKEALECFPKAADQEKLICGVNSDGDTPLHLAAQQHYYQIAELLRINCKHSPNCRSVQNKVGKTPLHVALMNGGHSIQLA